MNQGPSASGSTASTTQASDLKAAVELIGLTKSFGSVVAVDAIDLRILEV